jgi:hypothetical protein
MLTAANEVGQLDAITALFSMAYDFNLPAYACPIRQLSYVIG